MKNLITKVLGTRKRKYSEPKLKEMSTSNVQTHTVSFGMVENIWRALCSSNRHALIFGEFQTINMLRRGYLAYAIAAISLLGGCTKDCEGDAPKPDTGKTDVAVTVQSDHIKPASRAVIDDGYESGKFSGKWTAGDKIALTAVSLDKTERVALAYNTATGSFRGKMNKGTASRTYRVVYPYSTTENTIPFGRDRRQKGNANNSAYDVMLSSPVTTINTQAGKDAKGKSLVFNLKHLTATIAAHFTTSDAAVAQERVKAVIVSATDAPMSAQSLNIDTANGTASLDTKGQSKHIAITYAAAPTAKDIRAFLNIPAGRYGTLTFDILTDKHVATVVSAALADKQCGTGELHYLKTNISNWSEITAPTAVWSGNADFKPMEIADDMTGKCTLGITASAGVRKMSIKIDSPVLTPKELESVGLAAEMDIVDNDRYAKALAQFGLTTGDALVGKHSTAFNIEKLVPLIKAVAGGTTGENRFVIKVEDYAGNTMEKSMVFVIKPEKKEETASVVYNNDADLWTNTATVTAKNAVGNIAVRYKRMGERSWFDTKRLDGNTFRIEPAYSETQSAGGQTVRKAVQGTGVHAGGEYEVEVIANGTTVAKTSFRVGSTKDAIPNAGMDDWSEYEIKGMAVGGKVSYPNKTGNNKFWVSGNNAHTPHLCTNDRTAGFNGTGCAKLEGKTAFDIFAAGNLFTGDMAFGTTLSTLGCGYARFGQKYAFTARPSALKVRIKAKVGTMTHIGKNNPHKEFVKGRTKDVARICFCITDWRERHTVQGGMQLDKNTLWNPATQNAVAEGKILGYGSIDITGSTVGWQEITIPALWYDTETRPADGNYSLVISAASSAYGDYLTGSTASSLCIEDFEWVY